MSGPVPCGPELYIIAENARQYLIAEDGTTFIIAEHGSRKARVSLYGPMDNVIELDGSMGECDCA